VAPTRRALLGFVATGVIVVGRGWWSYTDLAPVIPGLGVGLVAILRWVLIPLFHRWFVRRQLA
jgi:hypothetical protein